MYGVRKYDQLLRYRKFILVTDNKALCHLHTLATPTALWNNWLSELSSYDFWIQHRAGKDNLNADHLSRAEHLRNAEETSEGMRAAEEENEAFEGGGMQSLAERCTACN